ncbi:metal dependent phosphohydrolase [Delphinella strobiligena]|nr:metal dependent phosphohydrolase [Delphinella strobiligena]
MAALNDAVVPALPDEISRHLPQTRLSITALSLANQNLALPIFNHSLRVFLLSKWLAGSEGSEWVQPENLELLLVAAIFHDMGTSDLYNGKQRFEVEGADGACAHLHAHNISKEQSHQVWTAIALHTSPEIAERISPLARLVRLGVLIDFKSSVSDQYGARNYSEEIESYLPRLDVEKVLGDAVVKQAIKIPEKAPAVSWPNSLLNAHLEDPDYKGVNRAF